MILCRQLFTFNLQENGAIISLRIIIERRRILNLTKSFAVAIERIYMMKYYETAYNIVKKVVASCHKDR